MSDPANQWKRISELFEEAMDLPLQEWMPFLEKQCTEEEKQNNIPEKVMKLLNATEGADDFFDNLGNRIESEMENSFEDIAVKPGDNFKQFKVIRQIGKGGMASVFLCERDDGQFDQTVALKIMNIRGNQDSLKERFKQEQKILARINHPNIALLFDGGITEEGFPFIIMEYIEGVPVDQYCEDKKLSLKQKIRLFLQVCDALHYAHNNLIVHHDIKPANILVKENGQVKLLDFGISHILFEQEKEKNKQDYRFSGTISYSSPEQLQGIAPTVASDIYSTGLVLFKLITGKSFADEYPDVFSQKTDWFPTKDDLRKFEPLRNQQGIVLSDLDAILTQTLNPDPSKRFSSLAELTHDLNNLLENRPLHCHKQSAKYKTMKMYRRNKAKVWLLVFFNIAIFISVGFFIDQYFKTLEEKQRAEQILEYVWDVFELSDPRATQGDTITAFELLERSTERIQLLDDQQELQAELYKVTGDLFAGIGFWERGGEQYKLALQQMEKMPGTKNLRLLKAQTLIEYAAYYRNFTKLDTADSTISESIRILEEHNLKNTLAYSSALKVKSTIKRAQGEFDDAIRYGKEGLEVWENIMDEPDLETASHYNNLGSIYRDMSEFEKSRELMDKAVSIVRNEDDLYHRISLVALNNMAILLSDMAEYEESNDYYMESYQLKKQMFGEKNPTTIITLVNIAANYYREQNYEKSDSINLSVLDDLKEIFGEDHTYTATTTFNLANSYLGQKKFDEALIYQRQVLELDKKAFGETHHYVAGDYYAIGLSFIGLNQPDSAKIHLEKALDLYLENFDEKHISIARTYSNLGEVHSMFGETDKAREYFTKAISIGTDLLGDEHTSVQNFKEAMAESIGEE